MFATELFFIDASLIERENVVTKIPIDKSAPAIFLSSFFFT